MQSFSVCSLNLPPGICERHAQVVSSHLVIEMQHTDFWPEMSKYSLCSHSITTVSYLTFSLHHCHRHSCLSIKQASYTWRTDWLNSKTACWQTEGKQPFEWRSNCHFLLSVLIYQHPVSGSWQVQDMLLPGNCWSWFEIQTKVSSWWKTAGKSIFYNAIYYLQSIRYE